MKADIPKLGFGIPEISQVAFVVEDLRDAMERFGFILGIGPWQAFRFEPPGLKNTTFRGEPREYSMMIGLSKIGDLRVELIEPISGESIYTEHLHRHGEGLHHIACFTFDEPREIVRAYEDSGISVIQSGDYKGGKFWYLDTQDILNGLLFEIVDPITSTLTPDWTYPE